MNEGDLITVAAKSARGKQLICQHGKLWHIVRQANVQFAPGEHWLIQPAAGNPEEFDSARRWIHPTDDKCFEVVK